MDHIIFYRPDILMLTCNSILGHINKINVNSLLKAPINTKLQMVASFTRELGTNMIIPLATADDVDGYIQAMHIAMEHEFAVANHIRELERYHCAVIGALNPAYDVCRQMIDGLITM